MGGNEDTQSTRPPSLEKRSRQMRCGAANSTGNKQKTNEKVTGRKMGVEHRGMEKNRVVALPERTGNGWK